MKLPANASLIIGEINKNDARWLAVVNRNPDADGQFYLAVKTTGIYCRPSCPARLPKLTNALFFQQREQAETAGFRACKRCKPDRWESIQKAGLMRRENET